MVLCGPGSHKAARCSDTLPASRKPLCQRRKHSNVVPPSASVPGFSTSSSLGGAGAPLGTLLAAALCQNTPCRGARDGEGLCRANIWSAIQMESKHSDDDECIYAILRLSRLRVFGVHFKCLIFFFSYFLVRCLFSPLPLISDVYAPAFSTCACALPASQPRLLFTP